MGEVDKEMARPQCFNAPHEYSCGATEAMYLFHKSQNAEYHAANPKGDGFAFSLAYVLPRPEGTRAPGFAEQTYARGLIKANFQSRVTPLARFNKKTVLRRDFRVGVAYFFAVARNRVAVDQALGFRAGNLEAFAQ